MNKDTDAITLTDICAWTGTEINTNKDLYRDFGKNKSVEKKNNQKVFTEL